jgi:hypothetical protein
MKEEVYRDLLTHMKHHRVKKWLLRGAKRERAGTIGNAIRQMPEWQLIRGLARVLAEDPQ